MEDVLWYRKPLLSEPVAVLAFEGWSDAGNTASGCVENLSGTFDIEPFAELNSEGFYNYQMRRPLVEVKDVGQREFHWPQTSFYSIEDYKLKNDLIKNKTNRQKTYILPSNADEKENKFSNGGDRTTDEGFSSSHEDHHQQVSS